MLDEKDFEALFKANFVALTAYCRRMVGDMDTAKEIAHKSFVKLWEKREMLKDTKNYRAMVFKIAYHFCINNYRDNRKFVSDDVLVEKDRGTTEINDGIDAGRMQAIVVETVNSLPEKCRKVFIMSRYDNMPNANIAQTLGVSIKTVEAHITSAIKALKKKLGKG